MITLTASRFGIERKNINMNSPLQLAIKYCAYLFRASNGKGHGIHSPFIYDFVRNVLNDKRVHEGYVQIESIRHKALKNQRVLQVQDFGAGSARGLNFTRTVSAITNSAAKRPAPAQLLYRLARYYKPAFIVELGTSLGISSAYLASGNINGSVITAEGSVDIASVAQSHFEQLDLKNIKIITGDFAHTLPCILAGLPQVDMVFVDGNHRKAPTIDYLQQILPKLSVDSMIIFDDIHWSRDMELAWKEIKDHPAIMCTVDLFFMGIVFFRPAFKVKQHFTIRY